MDSVSPLTPRETVDTLHIGTHISTCIRPWSPTGKSPGSVSVLLRGKGLVNGYVAHADCWHLQWHGSLGYENRLEPDKSSVSRHAPLFFSSFFKSFWRSLEPLPSIRLSSHSSQCPRARVQISTGQYCTKFEKLPPQLYRQ